MADDIKKTGELVKAKTSSLQKRNSNIVSRGLSDLGLLDVEKAGIIEEEELLQANEWFEKGNRYSLNKEYDKAINAYTNAIVLDPNDTSTYNNRGAAYAGKGEYDMAIKDYNKAIELNPNDALAYNNLGLAYKNKGQYDRAIEDYNKVIALDPNYGGAYNGRGIAYEMKGALDKAISDFQKACDLGSEVGRENLEKVLRQK